LYKRDTESNAREWITLLIAEQKKKKNWRFSHTERISRTTATRTWNETTSLRRTSSCFTWRAARRECEREKLERTVWRLQRKCVFWEKWRVSRERVRWGASWHVWACESKVVALSESIKCRILIGCLLLCFRLGVGPAGPTGPSERSMWWLRSHRRLFSWDPPFRVYQVALGVILWSKQKLQNCFSTFG